MWKASKAHLVHLRPHIQDLLTKEKEERAKEFAVLSADYSKLLEEHGKLLARDGRDNFEMTTLRGEIEDMRYCVCLCMGVHVFSSAIPCLLSIQCCLLETTSPTL